MYCSQITLLCFFKCPNSFGALIVTQLVNPKFEVLVDLSFFIGPKKFQIMIYTHNFFSLFFSFFLYL